MDINLGKKDVVIYLAGKIRSNGWRQSIIDIRNHFYDFNYPAASNLKNALPINYRDNIFISGPFFLSCDHSCYHGEESHGLGRGKMTCAGKRGFTEEEVIDICKAQIEKSDIVLAYIDDDTCYGSLYELGLASAMGKIVITIFDTKVREQKMWFVARNSDYSLILGDQKMRKSQLNSEIIKLAIEISNRIKAQSRP
jgi:hypothetical protein